MIGAVTTSACVITDRLPPLNSVKFTKNTISIKSAFHTAFDAKPAVERTVRSRRPESLYEVLRVDRNATPTEIKTAYRSLAKVYHPDASNCKQHGDRDFIEIHNAYATLSDPAGRANYDLKLGLVGRRQGFYICRRWETDQCW